MNSKDHLPDLALLESILGTSMIGIQLLEIIYNDRQEPVDFRHFPFSSDLQDENAGNGSLVLAAHPEIGDSRLFAQLLSVASTGEPLNEILNHTGDAQDRWFRIKAQRMAKKIFISTEDHTEVKDAEKKMFELNRILFAKNRELEALSSELKTFNTIAANDYNETLRNLYTCMEYLITNDAQQLSNMGKANIRRAQAAIQKMKLLTEDIVAFSSILPEKSFAPVDLNSLLAIVVSNLDQKIRNSDSKVLYKDLPVINGYHLLLSILFTHLLDNAIKFAKPDTSPVVHVTHVLGIGTDIKHPGAVRDQHYHIISIVDNGMGFDPENSENIFTIFYRINEKGKFKRAGIGLAICKKIMDLHGGFIVAECNPECTTFRCYFPA